MDYGCYLKNDVLYWSNCEFDKDYCYDEHGKYKCGLREWGEEPYHLNKCLERIFPNNVFIHNKYMKINNEYVINRMGSKIRPDYMCEELKMVVEFDGEPWMGGGHYTDPNVALKDLENKAILEDLGYKVIRIPFYVQLDNDAIEYYFGVKYTGDPLYDMYYDHGFIFPECKTPAYFCMEGLKKFQNDLFELPSPIATRILFSLGYRILFNNNNKINTYENIIPTSLSDICKGSYAHHNISIIFNGDIINESLYKIMCLPCGNDDILEDIDYIDDDCIVGGKVFKSRTYKYSDKFINEVFNA